MPSYKCGNCGKTYDPEIDGFCPKCGTATPPSIISRVERKQTAARLRAEGMTHYDDHCHEDDAWKGSYGAQTHRAAVQSHEASLRAKYNAHNAFDVTARGSTQFPSQSTQNQQTRKPSPELFKILLPFSIILVYILFKVLFGIITDF